MAQLFSSRKEPSTPQRSQLSQQVEPRIGRIPLKGRYHRLPRKFEEDYRVTNSVLGKGYNGVVRVADNIHSSNKKHFAVKNFKTKGLSDHKRKQLDAEIEIFLCMDHPHIARLVDVYEATNAITIVMECAEGGELFDRVTKRRFSEEEAADATRQILLALNYIHSHGIVHRDMKLENILYDAKGTNHLKLIDFGFSKFLDSKRRLHTSCGTLAYIAPEVLKKDYTSQCDLWSLGVVTFIILSGHMPFHGSGPSIQDDITSGYYIMKHEHWKSISQPAQEFVRALLTVNPSLRLDAKSALEHKWITSRTTGNTKICPSVIDALLLWRTAPKFHRACMLMMAWLLTNEQQAQVRDYFLALDKNHDGAISFTELRDVMVTKFNIQEEEVQQVFALLDRTHHQEIHYSEFLAAMMASRIELTEDLLHMTFHHFDTRNSGHLAVEDFRVLLGDTFEGEPVETLMAEAHIDAADGKLSFTEFAKHAHACAPKSLGVSPSSQRRTFAPKLWAAMSGAVGPRSRALLEQSLPTLLPKDGEPARVPPATKPMAPLQDNKAKVTQFSTVVDLDVDPLPLPPLSDDAAADERQMRCRLADPYPEKGATRGIVPLPCSSPLWVAASSPVATPAYGAEKHVTPKACCSIQ
jgi:serine/threonine protein kinase